jgi:hypothetical protein
MSEQTVHRGEFDRIERIRVDQEFVEDAVGTIRDRLRPEEDDVSPISREGD